MATRTRKKPAAAKLPAADLMRIEYEPLSQLVAEMWKDNPKGHDYEELDDSMERFGYVVPPAKDEHTGKIYAGHGRITNLDRRKKAGQPPPKRIQVREEDGEWLVPVVRGVSFESPAQARAYLIADNRLVEKGGWLDKLLAPMLKEAQESEAGLDGLGWDDSQVTDLLAGVERMAAEASASQSVTGGRGGGSGAEVKPPEQFKEFDVNAKPTVSCPKCGFHVVLDS